MAEHVPLDNTATFTQIAKSSGLSEQLVERFTRHTMGNHVFGEREYGEVQHAAS